MKQFSLLLFTLLFYHLNFSQVPAFPGAEGFGANTVGGRGGKVIKVTNLNDHGPGSLREAIEAEGPRIVVFEVGGIINLETELSIKHPFITIAGQTAPGDGICLRGECLRIYTNDVVIRYIRSRPGDIDFGPPNTWDQIDAISIHEGYNIVIDHCSMSWSVDEVMDIWSRAHDVTIQNCIIAEALNRSKHPTGPHSMGMLIGKRATNISIHHNLFAHNNDRNPHVNGSSKVDFRNNVIYNPGMRAADFSGASGQQINFVNNHLIPGYNTHIKTDIILRKTDQILQKLYVSGNIGTNEQVEASDDWRLVKDYDAALSSRELQMHEEFPHPYISTLPASAVQHYIIENAGATLPFRDPVDRKIIRDVQERKGQVINRKSHVLEWPPLQTGVPPVDTDDDGIPDYWEKAHNLDENDPLDSSEKGNNDYTNIENYINGLSHHRSGGVQANTFKGGAASTLSLPPSPEIKFALEQNFPNPFYQSTNINFSIPEPSPVFIEVYDEVGRQRGAVLNAYLYEGKYSIECETPNLSPGVYTMVLKANNQNDVIKIIVQDSP